VPLTSAGDTDIFVAKYSLSGQHVWSRRFGSTGEERVQSVAIDFRGDVVVTGYFAGIADLGDGPQASVGGSGIFVAKYSGTNGAYMWAKRIEGPDDEMGYGVAVDGGGSIVVTGYFKGTVDFGGGPLSSTYGGSDTFIAKYSGDGGHLWSKKFRNNSEDIGYSVAIDFRGDVVVTGSFMGKIDLGNGVLITTHELQDIYVVKLLGADGSYVWSKCFGGAQSDQGYGVAVDSTGDVILTGFFSYAVDFGGGLLVTPYYDVFLVKLSGVNGSHIWSEHFGGGSVEIANSVTVDGNDDVIVTGYFTGTSDFGGGPLSSAGAYEIFVAKYSGGDGSHIWSKRFGGTSDDVGYSVSTDSNRNVLATGYFRGTVDFGGGPLTSAGVTDGFLIQLAP
jgi:hypothetical protein